MNVGNSSLVLQTCKVAALAVRRAQLESTRHESRRRSSAWLSLRHNLGPAIRHWKRTKRVEQEQAASCIQRTWRESHLKMESRAEEGNLLLGSNKADQRRPRGVISPSALKANMKLPDDNESVEAWTSPKRFFHDDDVDSAGILDTPVPRRISFEHGISRPSPDSPDFMQQLLFETKGILPYDRKARCNILFGLPPLLVGALLLLHMDGGHVWLTLISSAWMGIPTSTDCHYDAKPVFLPSRPTYWFDSATASSHSRQAPWWAPMRKPYHRAIKMKLGHGNPVETE
jgi:hypothetical protein